MQRDLRDLFRSSDHGAHLDVLADCLVTRFYDAKTSVVVPLNAPLGGNKSGKRPEVRSTLA